MAGAEEAEPIRVRRTADPLVLHLLFGYDHQQGGAAMGPGAFAVRVPRFYPHSVRLVGLFFGCRTAVT